MSLSPQPAASASPASPARRRQNLLWQGLYWLGALGWLGWYALTLRLPSSDGSASVYLQAASVLAGISLLGVLLLLGTRPRWSPLTRGLIFAGGIGSVLLAWRLQFKDELLLGALAIALICIALPVGYWIGNQMERLSHLIPLCIALSLADIYSVWQGPSRKAVEQIANYQQEMSTAAAQGVQAIRAVHAPLWGYFVVQLPLAGTGVGVPVLGVGDFVVLAFLLRAAWLNGIAPGKLLLAALLSTFAALAASQLSGMALPALPFIALGTVGWLWCAEPRVRRLGKQEVLLSLLVTAVFGGLLLVKALR